MDLQGVHRDYWLFLNLTFIFPPYKLHIFYTFIYYYKYVSFLSTNKYFYPSISGAKRGINTNIFVEKEDANVRVVYSVKLEEYKKFLLDVFAPSK